MLSVVPVLPASGRSSLVRACVPVPPRMFSPRIRVTSAATPSAITRFAFDFTFTTRSEPANVIFEMIRGLR